MARGPGRAAATANAGAATITPSGSTASAARPTAPSSTPRSGRQRASAIPAATPATATIVAAGASSSAASAPVADAAITASSTDRRTCSSGQAATSEISPIAPSAQAPSHSPSPALDGGGERERRREGEQQQRELPETGHRPLSWRTRDRRARARPPARRLPATVPGTQEARMTTKADFTEEEWARLERAPFVAGMAISIADPGGPIEAVKETSATLKTVLAAAEKATSEGLVGEVAGAAAADARARKNPLSGFKPRGAMAGEQILDELRAVHGILAEKATPEETAAYGDFIVSAAQAAADAAKEGGFMGFGAEQVSKGEQQMLDKLREVFPAAPAGG